MPSASCGRSMPGLLAQPRFVCVVRDVVDPHLVADVIEVDVAGMHDAFVQGHRAVAALLPALEVVAVELRAARAVDACIVVDRTALQAGQRHQRLEGRARRELRLDRPVQQRVLSGCRQSRSSRPVLIRAANLFGSKVGRLTMASTSPVRGSSATTAALRPPWQFRHRLQVEVDGQLQVFSGHRLLDTRAPARSRPRLSTTTCRCPSMPISSELYSRSMPNLPITSPGSYCANSARVELSFADLARVADDVRRHAVLRIQPPLRRESPPSPGRNRGANPRRAGPPGSVSSLMTMGSYLGRVAEAVEPLHQIVVVQLQPFGDGLQMFAASGSPAKESG